MLHNPTHLIHWKQFTLISNLGVIFANSWWHRSEWFWSVNPGTAWRDNTSQADYHNNKRDLTPADHSLLPATHNQQLGSAINLPGYFWILHYDWSAEYENYVRNTSAWRELLSETWLRAGGSHVIFICCELPVLILFFKKTFPNMSTIRICLLQNSELINSYSRHVRVSFTHS